MSDSRRASMNDGFRSAILPRDASSPDSGIATVPATTETPIPKLVSITPAIFVPVEESLLEPFDAPREKVERLQLSMKKMEDYSEDVKRNLMHLFLQERDRIVQQRIRYEETWGVAGDACSPEEIEAMLLNAMAPPDPKRDYTKPTPLATQPSRPPREAGPTPRELALEELLALVETAVSNVTGFSMLMADKKLRLEGAIEREKAQEAQFLRH